MCRSVTYLGDLYSSLNSQKQKVYPPQISFGSETSGDTGRDQSNVGNENCYLCCKVEQEPVSTAMTCGGFQLDDCALNIDLPIKPPS